MCCIENIKSKRKKEKTRGGSSKKAERETKKSQEMANKVTRQGNQKIARVVSKKSE